MGTLSAVTVNAAPAAITVTATASAVLNGVATVTATATGGTAPYQFSINGGVTYQSSGTFAGIAVGASVTITVKDAMGCTSTSAPITITGGSNPIVSLTATVTVSGQVTCNGGTATLTVNATGGTAPYTYSINGAAYVSSNVFSNLTGGVYTVIVKDATGALYTAASVTVNASVNITAKT